VASRLLKGVTPLPDKQLGQTAGMTATTAIDRVETGRITTMSRHENITSSSKMTTETTRRCGILGERPKDVDSDTHTGMRFAAMWLKQRNQDHANTLHTACSKLRAIRGR